MRNKTMNRFALTLVVMTVMIASIALTRAQQPPATRPPGVQSPVSTSGLGPTVKLDSGLVSGARAGARPDVLVFKGIPYAAPPVGDLRWKPPQPAPPWNGVREAKEFGAMCCYRGPLADRWPMDEDCLSLNIWTLAKSAVDRLPVIVWIHGGGFQFGSSRWDWYDDLSALARQGAVVVSINYRLNLFGFLAHPDLSAESPESSSGNYGLLDQIAALKWIRGNIHQFGGDPEKVTLFGQSAGGTSVALLMISPLAKGLFHRAIAHSSRIFSSTAYLKEARYGIKAAETSGLDHAPRIATLRSKSAKELLSLAKTPEAGFDILALGLDYWPVVDGWVIPADPAELFEAGRFHQVPLLVGTTATEGTFFVTIFPCKTDRARYEEWIKLTYLDSAPRVLERYPVREDKDACGAVGSVLGSSEFYYGTRTVARAASSRGVPTWMFHFTRASPLHPWARMGAMHGIEVGYVLGTLTDKEFEAKDRVLSDTMMAAWVRFAKTGNPNGGELPNWPQYEKNSDRHLEFGNSIRVGTNLFSAELDSWSDIWTGLRKRAR